MIFIVFCGQSPAALIPVENNACVMSSYPHFSEVLKYNNIKFPISFSNITKFLKINKKSNQFLIQFFQTQPQKL